MRSSPILLCLLPTALVMGCAVGTTAIKELPRTVVVALDTSSSAKTKHEELYNRIVRQMEETNPSDHLIIFRFDSSPAEIYDGKAITDGAEAGKTIKSELSWQSKTTGTNLAKLFERIDKRVAPNGVTQIDIYTDCGTEEMTTRDNDTVGRISKKWMQSGNVHLAFHGVTTGYREKLRDLVAMPVEID